MALTNNQVEDLRSYGTVAGRGFQDEFMKIATQVANASEEIEEPQASTDNVRGNAEPVQNIETNTGATNPVPEEVKKLVKQVAEVKNTSTNGPTMGENVEATQLAGDPNTSTQVSDLPATKITDAETAGDVEKAAQDLRVDIIRKVFGY